MTLAQRAALRWRRDFSENIWMALATLRANKLRSGLTLLGIIVAVMVVIIVVALLVGFDRQVQTNIQQWGVNTAFFHRFAGGIRFGRLSKEERMRKPLTYEDFLAVKEACTACVSATVSIYPNDDDFARVRYKGEEMVGLDFRGATGEFFSVYANAVVKHGRPFTEAENLHRAEVVVIGEDVAKALFGPEEPLGKEVLANGHSYTVVGVFEKPKGAAGPGGGGEDRRVTIPYWTFRKVYPTAEEHGIRIEGYPGQLPEAIDLTRMALRTSRRVAIDKPDNFGYDTSDSIIEQFHQIVGIVALVTVVLASVGLMIGGVGVMNIMLVSVTERTREIGVRKAIGARRRDIVWQFLVEAMAMTGSGGIIGVLLGIGVAAAIGALLQWNASVPAWAVILAVAVAASVGLFFGMYPAVKAAKLDPVVALRYE
jgi:ABC-type antimicrobial peptide transport system permease subunit